MPTEYKATGSLDLTSTTNEIPEKNSSDVITHDEFLDMIDVLEALENHTHTYNDKYYANCQCQCSSGGMM